MRPRAVLFDLDNTLINRNLGLSSYALRFATDFAGLLDVRATAEFVAAVLVERDNGGYVTGDGQIQSVGEALLSGLADDLPWNKRPSKNSLLAHLTKFSASCVVEMPGASELIRELVARGVKIGIVSNGSEASRRDAVRALSMNEAITSLVSSERAGVRKPDVRIFILAAQELGVDPSDCWFIGDHPVNDFQGASDAGMKAVWLEGFHGWPLVMAPPTRSAALLSDLLVMLESA